MEQAYAQALAHLIQKGMSPDDAVAKIRHVLKAHGRTELLPKIARAFARIMDREASRDKVVLTVARHKDMHHALEEAKKFLAMQHFGEFDLERQVDESLIGGWRLEGKNMLLDASWKKDLISMYNRATA
jgi:F0F1-type ATP synthase delta subunit